MSARFAPCAVIPTYDNPRTIEAVVRDVQAHVRDVIVVDDGSAAAGRAAVDRLRDRPGVVIHRRPSNGGKGAAVKDGLALAGARGFTHAVQIDADGQHDIADIPRFLEAARRDPRALIAGTPLFDDSAPTVRIVGRRLNGFWTRITTAGRRVIDDALCGFRVYPIEQALLANARSDAMDFDPEIVVRMIWNEVPVVNIPTRVRYLSAAEGGVSHYRMVRDNARITRMHTRLVLEALLRGLARR